MLMISFFPILNYDYHKIDKIQKPTRIFLNVVSLIFIVFSLVQLPGIISNFTKSIVQLLLVSSAGLDLYNDSMSESYSLGDGTISNLPSIITNAYGNFGILLFFYYLTLEDRKAFMTVGLFLSCIIGLLSSVSLGQRGPIIEILLSFVITYFAIKKFFKPKIRKIIGATGIVFLIVVTVPIIALTNSRFGDTIGGSDSSVFYYAGQQNIIFNNYGLDNGGIRYGDRVFPFFKRMLGFENIPNNFWERRNKYPNLIVTDEFFIGFVGDFTLDFGPYLTPIIIIVFSTLVYFITKVRGGIMLFHQLILLHFLMTVCMLGGLKLYPYSDLGGNLQLILYFMAFIFFKLDYDSKQNKAVADQ
jgi:oligosaccharide repeat unit polymerase